MIFQKITLGVLKWENGDVFWYKNGNHHKENGPARIYKNGYKMWNLNNKFIWSSVEKLALRNQIILSKTQHPNYPTVQVWKILDKDKVYEQTIIPGMEKYIQE